MILSIDNVEFSYGKKHVLKGASFTFEKGRIYGLLGRNGAGKTLFLTVSAET
jgi:ABC-2 type transport system ATP-binding protein